MARISIVFILLLLAACTPIRPELLEPGLAQQLLDPARLAEICGASHQKVGPPSKSRMSFSKIQNERDIHGDGQGTAELVYRPLGESFDGKVCWARIAFEYNDGGQESVNAGSILFKEVTVLEHSVNQAD